MIHPVDLAASALFRFGPASLKVFGEGWGDKRHLELLRVDPAMDLPGPASIDWSNTVGQDDHVVTDGTFPSPADLPPEAAIARVRKVAPTGHAERTVVLMAAWNDHDYRTRTRLARPLAARGIASIMVMNPYYGERRTLPDPPIRTVGDFAAMGHAAVLEGLSVLRALTDSGQIGVAGYSMGGNIAALIGALSDRPVAIAGLAASHSPAPVWLDGVIRHAVDWKALDADARRTLRSTLAEASVLAVPAKPHTRHAVLVGASGDGYIPKGAVLALHEHWPGSDLRWIRAGHATMIWRHLDELVDAVVDSFDRLQGP